MPIELAKIQLNRVHKVDTLEQAALVHHQVPGMEGNATQNLGRDSVRLQIEGIFYGTKAGADLETLRKVYKTQEPVDFLADIVGQAYFAQVLLETFEVAQAAALPDQFSYRLTIAEYVPPKKSAAQNKAAVNSAIKMKALAMMDIASLPDAISFGSIPELTNPAAPLIGAMGNITKATGGLSELGGGFAAMSAVELVVPETAPPAIEIEPIELGWLPVTVPTDQLLRAGVLAKSLLDRGASVENLLKAGATTHGLLAAGVSDADLAKAGISQADLDAAKQVKETLETEAQPLWVAIALVDEDGDPMLSQAYRVTQKDGTAIEGLLDDQGLARVEVMSLQCSVSFPELDAVDWRFPAGEPPEFDLSQRGTHWLSFRAVGDDGLPLADEPYEIILPDGTPLSGRLDDQGQARIDYVPEGSCTLTFPNLDAEDWRSQAEVDAAPLPDQGSGLKTNDSSDEGSTGLDTFWLAIALVDEEGNPLLHEPYRVIQANGTILDGVLDDQGQARIEGVTPQCQVTFPNLDADDWHQLPDQGENL